MIIHTETMSTEIAGTSLPVHTLEETAQALNMSVYQVRRIEQIALKKLRANAEIRRMARDRGILKGELLCSSN